MTFQNTGCVCSLAQLLSREITSILKDGDCRLISTNTVCKKNVNDLVLYYCTLFVAPFR